MFQHGETRIGAMLYRSIVKVRPGEAQSLAADHEEQIRVPHVLKNMGRIKRIKGVKGSKGSGIFFVVCFW